MIYVSKIFELLCRYACNSKKIQIDDYEIIIYDVKDVEPEQVLIYMDDKVKSVEFGHYYCTQEKCYYQHKSFNGIKVNLKVPLPPSYSFDGTWICGLPTIEKFYTGYKIEFFSCMNEEKLTKSLEEMNIPPYFIEIKPNVTYFPPFFQNMRNNIDCSDVYVSDVMPDLEVLPSNMFVYVTKNPEKLCKKGTYKPLPDIYKQKWYTNEQTEKLMDELRRRVITEHFDISIYTNDKGQYILQIYNNTKLFEKPDINEMIKWLYNEGYIIGWVK